LISLNTIPGDLYISKFTTVSMVQGILWKVIFHTFSQDKIFS
jgi:hypothetical protein